MPVGLEQTGLVCEFLDVLPGDLPEFPLCEKNRMVIGLVLEMESDLRYHFEWLSEVVRIKGSGSE